MPLDDLNDRPALFIPSYPPPAGFGSDTGLVRPVPPAIPYYLCPGIQALTAFAPGSPLSVTVNIGNWQGGNSASLAMAAVWWSPAFSGAIIPNPKNFIGFASLPLPPHGAQDTTHVLTANIPVNAPATHICLVAKVWHALDMPSTTLIGGKQVEVADPVNDRHWAQHNLFTVQAQGSQSIRFLATNPLPHAARFNLLVRPLDRKKWPALTKSERATPVLAHARLRLSDSQGTVAASATDILRQEITLQAGEQQEMEISVELTESLPLGTFAAYEVLQLTADKPAGGFGIVLRSGQ